MILVKGVNYVIKFVCISCRFTVDKNLWRHSHLHQKLIEQKNMRGSNNWHLRQLLLYASKSSGRVASGSHSQLLRCQSYHMILIASQVAPWTRNTWDPKAWSILHRRDLRLVTLCRIARLASCRTMSPNWDILTSAAWTQCTTEIIATWTRSTWNILGTYFAQRILSESKSFKTGHLHHNQAE